MSDNRYRICVIGAEVNNTEQRQILSGIIGEAQKKNAVVFVLSNLYNHLEPARHDSADNMISGLMLSSCSRSPLWTLRQGAEYTICLKSAGISR